MQERTMALAAIAVLNLLIVAGAAMAQGFWKNKPQNGWQGMPTGMMQGNMMNGMMQHHEQMEETMEKGTYSDLVKLREEYGFRIMPWVENEQDFQLARQMHEKMEKYAKENGFGAGHCPMMQGFT